MAAALDINLPTLCLRHPISAHADEDLFESIADHLARHAGVLPTDVRRQIGHTAVRVCRHNDTCYLQHGWRFDVNVRVHQHRCVHLPIRFS